MRSRPSVRRVLRVVLACGIVLGSGVMAAPGRAASGNNSGPRPLLVSESAPSPTALALVWSASGAKRLRLYMKAGRKPPGTLHHPPHRPPLKALTCPCPGGADRITILVRGLVTGHIYDFALYGSYGHGVVTRGVSRPVLARVQGLHLSGAGVVNSCPRGGVVLRDAAGGYHAFGGCGLHQSYYTRPAGATTWSQQPLRGANRMALTPDGTEVDATAIPGNADQPPAAHILATAAPATARELPAPSEVNATHECTGEGYDVCPTGLVAFPNGDMGILLAENCEEVDSNIDRLVLSVGQPGEPFTETTVADYGYDGCRSGNDGTKPLLGPGSMVQDSSTGQLVVVAWSNVDGPGYYAWTQDPGQPWVGPVKFVSTTAETWYGDALQPSSLVADKGEVWVGLDRAPERRNRTIPRSGDGAFLVHRSPTGVWDAVVRVPGSDSTARTPVLATNGETLSVLYGRADPKDRVGGSGLRYVSRAADGTWSTTSRLTRWWLDKPVAVFPGATPTPTVAYLRR